MNSSPEFYENYTYSAKNKESGYLSDKRGVITMLEIFREDSLWKELFIYNYKAYSIGGPLNTRVALRFLNKNEIYVQ